MLGGVVRQGGARAGVRRGALSMMSQWSGLAGRRSSSSSSSSNGRDLEETTVAGANLHCSKNRSPALSSTRRWKSMVAPMRSASPATLGLPAHKRERVQQQVQALDLEPPVVSLKALKEALVRIAETGRRSKQGGIVSGWGGASPPLWGKEQEWDVRELLRHIVLSPSELERFSVADPSKQYTRNVVAYHELFTVLCLSWKPGIESMIHNHPSAGCWIKTLEGGIVETMYEEVVPSCTREASSGGSVGTRPLQPRLVQTKELHHREGEVSYIDDSMGYHKVSNSSNVRRAVTLHVYSPAFEECQTWRDTDSTPELSSMACDNVFV